MVSLAEIVAQRIARRRALREELAPLAQDAMTEEMRTLAYIEGLHSERAGVEQHLRRAESLAPGGKVEVPLTPPQRWPSAAVLASELRARLEGIDAEIERVSR